jgi:hypothetical protein
MPKLLTRLRIDEISSVDSGAGEGVKIVLAKRDDATRRDADFFRKLFASVGKNNAHRLADALVAASDHQISHEQAMNYLSSEGLLTQKKDNPSMLTRTEQLKAFAKNNGGVVRVAKFILAEGAHGISEHDFTEMITEEARQHKRSGETDAQAFSKLFCDNTPEAILLRKAHAVVKGRAI